MNDDRHKLEEFDKMEEVEVSDLKKWLFGVIDATIVISFWFLLTRYLPYGSPSQSIRAVNPTVFMMILLVVSRLATIVVVAATPGMLLFKIRFLNGLKYYDVVNENRRR